MLRAVFHARKFVNVFTGLVRDRRVPALAKVLPLAVVAWVLCPVDLDWIPFAGWLDDLAVVIIGGGLFMHFCPADVVAEHIAIAEGRLPKNRPAP